MLNGVVLTRYFTFPDKEMISKMLERLKKLLNSFSVQRSLAVNFIEQQEIIQLVELRVVREFNLPDNYVNVLRVSLQNLFQKSKVELDRIIN